MPINLIQILTILIAPLFAHMTLRCEIQAGTRLKGVALERDFYMGSQPLSLEARLGILQNCI